MPRNRNVIAVTKETLAEVNALAASLTADGPGRYGQAETIGFLLGQYREYQALLDDIRNSYQETP